MAWGRWVFAKLRVTCESCIRSQEAGLRKVECAGINSVDECPTGEVPRLAEENGKFWWWFQRVTPALFDSMGGVNTGAIRDTMDIYGVPDGQRPIIYEKALIMVAAIREVREKERAKDG